MAVSHPKGTIWDARPLFKCRLLGEVQTTGIQSYVNLGGQLFRRTIEKRGRTNKDSL